MDSLNTSEAFGSQSDAALQAKLYYAATPDRKGADNLEGTKLDYGTQARAYLPTIEISDDTSTANDALTGQPFALPKIDFDEIGAARKSAQDEQARFQHEKRRQAQDAVRHQDVETMKDFDAVVETRIELAVSTFERTVKAAANKGLDCAAVYDIPERPVLRGDQWGPRQRSEYNDAKHGYSYGGSPENQPRRLPPDQIVELDIVGSKLRDSEKQFVESLIAGGWNPRLLVRANGSKAICVQLP